MAPSVRHWLIEQRPRDAVTGRIDTAAAPLRETQSLPDYIATQPRRSASEASTFGSTSHDGFPETAGLFADFKPTNDVEIALRINSLEVIQQPPATADHHQQPTATSVVLLVGLKMRCELGNAIGEEGDLHLWRARVGL
jgi:hypothetical protein